jgi:hypothetical protein
LEEYVGIGEEEQNQYISLQEAAQSCSYSQEYFSLRARQGKLQALKVKKNWVTTKEWLEEYVVSLREMSRRDRTSAINPVRDKEVRYPENLPVEEVEEEVFSEQFHWLPIFTRAGVALLTGLAVVFFAAGGVAFGKHGFFEMAARANTFVQEFGEGFEVGSRMVAKAVPEKLQETQEIVEIFAKDFENAFVYGIHSPASVGEVAEEYVSWLKENIVALPHVAPKAYAKLNQKIEQGLQQDFKNAVQGYKEMNDGLTFAVTDSARDIKNAYANVQKGITIVARTIPAFIAKEFQETYQSITQLVKREEFGNQVSQERNLVSPASPAGGPEPEPAPAPVPEESAPPEPVAAIQ